MSTLNVDKVDPSTGTALELGTSGDTITVPTGAGLTVVDEVKTNKISPATGTAFALGDSGDTFTVPSGATIVNSGTATGFGITQTSFLPTANPLIINGNMAVAQRSTSVAAVVSGVHTLDRWGTNKQGSPGTWTQTQESLSAADQATTGQKTALKMDCTAANSSLDATDYLAINYSFEGQDLQVFKKGTSAAETMTIAFWVKSTKTGTYCIFLFDEDNSRMMSNSYTVDTTDTWEQKIFAVPADTTGAFGNDNGNSFQIYFVTIAGSNFTSGSLATSWATYSQVNEATGQVNAGDSTSNNFHITGVQLEVGTYTSADLPPFRFESYSDNLQRCWRYFWALCPADALSANSRVGLGATLSTTRIEVPCIFPVRMRTKPTLVSSGTVDDFYLYDLITNSETTTGIGLTASGSGAAQGVYHLCASGLTAGSATQVLTGNTNARLSFDSEF